MNNKYIATLICITVLALAPACCRKSCSLSKKNRHKEDVKTMIELDNSVFEVESEEDNDDANVVKF